MTHLTFLNHDRCTTSPIAEIWLPDISHLAYREISLYSTLQPKQLQKWKNTFTSNSNNNRLSSAYGQSSSHCPYLHTHSSCYTNTWLPTHASGASAAKVWHAGLFPPSLYLRGTAVCRWLAGCRRGRHDNALKPPVANVRHFLFMFVSFSASGYKNINLPTPVKRQVHR